MDGLELLNARSRNAQLAALVEPRCDRYKAPRPRRRGTWSARRLDPALNRRRKYVVRLLGASAPPRLPVKLAGDGAADFSCARSDPRFFLCASVTSVLKLCLAPEKISTGKGTKEQRRTEYVHLIMQSYCCTVERCEGLFGRNEPRAPAKSAPRCIPPVLPPAVSQWIAPSATRARVRASLLPQSNAYS